MNQKELLEALICGGPRCGQRCHDMSRSAMPTLRQCYCATRFSISAGAAASNCGRAEPEPDEEEFCGEAG